MVRVGGRKWDVGRRQAGVSPTPSHTEGRHSSQASLGSLVLESRPAQPPSLVYAVRRNDGDDAKLQTRPLKLFWTPAFTVAAIKLAAM